MLNPLRSERHPWLAAARAVALAAALAAVPAIAQENDKDKGKDQPKPKEPQQTEQKADPAASAPKPAAAPGTGVVLKPEVVDGTVSAYSAAVRQPDPAAKVYTNADLEKIWAGDTAPWATSPSEAPPAEAAGAEGAPAAPTIEEPLEWMDEQGARAQDRARAIADAERELAAANAAVANYEKQLLAVRNPYAARPKLSDDEKKARADGDTIGARVTRAEEQLAEARERVANAQAKLNQARRSR